VVKFCAVLAFLLTSVGPAGAQIVRGTVTDMETKAPLRGVFVVLLDSAGHMRGGVLTDERGLYALHGPTSGTFTLRAELIGHQSTTSAAFVLAGQARSVDMRVAVAPIALAPVGVEASSRCIRRPRQGERTAQLWEEVRKALSVTQWAERQRTLQFEMRSYIRELDARTLHVRNEAQRHDVTGRRPYAAADVDTLIRYGFVRNEGAGVVFYGPDADLLLSNAFLDHHCFHTVAGDKEKSGMAGLAFQPAIGSKLPDIAGILWLDERTLELKFIEYHYVNLAPEYRVRGAGGRTAFRRLSTGVWIVSSWYIRMPTLAAGALRGTLRVTAIQEEGGEVVSIRDLRSTEHLAQDGTLMGVIFDSIGGRPFANAIAYLSGTAHRALTDSAGRFVISNIPPGKYLAAFTHPVLDSIPVFPTPRMVEVSALDTTRTELALAREDNLLNEACASAASAALIHKSGVIFGYVRDARGHAVPNATIKVQSNDWAGSRQSITDAGGHYTLCGVPAGSKLQLQASEGDRASARSTAMIDLRRFQRVDLQLRDE
jgi:hypothetical protein